MATCYRSCRREASSERRHRRARQNLVVSPPNQMTLLQLGCSFHGGSSPGTQCRTCVFASRAGVRLQRARPCVAGGQKRCSRCDDWVVADGSSNSEWINSTSRLLWSGHPSTSTVGPRPRWRKGEPEGSHLISYIEWTTLRLMSRTCTDNCSSGRGAVRRNSHPRIWSTRVHVQPA